MIQLVGGAAIDLDLDAARYVLSVLQGALILAKATGAFLVVQKSMERCRSSLVAELA